MSVNVFSNAQFTPWWWEWAPRQSRKVEKLPADADVVVVGSGYTGMMAALTLARGGRAVVVLEAEEIGHGASSRNGGQVGSGNQRFTVKRLTELYGAERARGLLQEGTAALDYVKAFIKDENIDCHLRETGRFRGASKPAHYESIARDLEDLKRVAGVEGYMVSRSEQSEEIGSSLYHGGCVLPGDMSVHPALYHTGIMERAEAVGVTLCSHARVDRLEETAAGMVVHSARGSVKCRDVLIATNGYTGSVTRDLQQKIVPVAAAMIATSELSPNLIAHLMPKQRVYGDTLRVHHYYQPSPDNKRLLFGGRLPGAAGTTDANKFNHLRQEMTEVFPELDDVELTHCWSGYVAITRDGLPHIGCAGPVYFAMGYNGSGVARASHAGHQVALQMLGQADALTAWNKLTFEHLPFHAFNRLGVRIAVSWKRLQDRYS